MQTIPAISLWQPYASLMAYELKRNETRSWSTQYRGPLVIHAAKVNPFNNPDVPDDVLQAAQITLNQKSGMHTPMPLGCIVGVVNVVDCVRTETIVGSVPPVEVMFGNYGKGRFAWQTDAAVRLSKPLPCRGMQGMFKVTLYRELLPALEALRAMVDLKRSEAGMARSLAYADLLGGGM